MGNLSHTSNNKNNIWCEGPVGAIQIYYCTQCEEWIAVTTLGSENCQSISLQNLLSASQAFQGLWLNTVNWGCKAAAVILPDYCTPHNLPFMSLCPDKAHGYKVKVQSEKMSASHLISQPVMMTSWLVSGLNSLWWIDLMQ